MHTEIALAECTRDRYALCFGLEWAKAWPFPPGPPPHFGHASFVTARTLAACLCSRASGSLMGSVLPLEWMVISSKTAVWWAILEHQKLYLSVLVIPSHKRRQAALQEVVCQDIPCEAKFALCQDEGS